MAYTVVYHPDVASTDVPPLNRDLRQRIARAIQQRLGEAPERYGHPLRGSLKGYWKLRVGDYRVVYRVREEEVWVLCIGHRREVYEIAAGRR